jgi:membrane-associated protease RseP (regulator of RpoE activity)
VTARLRLTTASLALVIGLTPLPAAAQWAPPVNCSVVSQNTFVRNVMLDIYYWYREIPAGVNPASFRSPEAYLQAIRYMPLDSSFSFIDSAAASQAFYSDSQYIGFGFATSYNGADLRVAQVFPESPAAEAGMARGDTFVSINGRTIAELVEADLLGSAFGPSEIGYESAIAFRRPTGEVVQTRLAKRLITIPTVTQTQVFALDDGRRVGYLFFRNFVEPSIAALDEAFTQLKAAQVNELVLDLRYNGGGLVSVAQHLASVIGGTRTEGQLLAQYFHNDRNAFRNRDIRFDGKEHALTLDRLVVVTTRSTASASELIVNALRPFIPVVTIGETTYGKPVGQYGITFCEKVLYPVAFTLRNVNGEGDYFGGFEPTCPAVDDIDHQLGDAQEASLGEALQFLKTGECTPRVDEVFRTLARRARLPKPTGFQALVNAY